jgi:glycosyltransferase involved in cell wall biosynthesis
MTDLPHILFVIDGLYGTAGGAEGILSRIVRTLPAHGYRCSIVTFASCPALVDAANFDCPVHCFPVRRLWGAHALRAAWRMARLIQRERVAVVHTFFEASDLLGGVVARICGRALISSRRDMGFRRSPAQRLAYRLATPLFTEVHAVASEVGRAHIAQDRLNPAKLVTVRNGVDLTSMDGVDAGLPPELGIPTGAPVVACVGNIRPVKGIEYLAGTAAEVCREVPDARFLVVGEVHDHRYFAHVRELIRRAGVSENVVFTGRRADVVAILKACTVFHMPSLSEGLSNALLEAMACSLPCVVTDVGGNREAVDDGRSGYVTAPGDEAGAAARILGLLSNRRRAAEMGRAGREIVEGRFTMRAMIEDLLRSYERVLDGRCAGARPRALCSRTEFSGD